MSKDLNVLLDKCIDRMNEGESLEECLASYPEQAEELRPLLRAVCNARDACSSLPRATAKSAVRQRLDAALVNAERSLRKPQRRPAPLFGWTKVWATVSIALVLALVGFGLNWALTPGVAPVVAQDNFRLLLSDEENAIGDFTSLEVTITSIGVQRGGESGGWEVITLEPAVVRDLTDLQGLNAQEIWSGELPEGQYTKVFIYIDNVSGTINGEPGEVKLPSGKLQIDKPFATAGDSLVNFVYDVTVIEAGQSGQYILLPQADQSGANQSYHEVGEGELTIQVVDGEVAPGEEITVLVTLNGSPVSGAQVEVNDDEIGETDADGLISFIVPDDDELEIETKKDGLKGELEIDLEGESELEQKSKEGELTIQVVDGEVAPGREITVLVTLNGSPVLDALVEVNDDEIGWTDADGLISFTVPDDDELEIEAVKGHLKGELEIELEQESPGVSNEELTLEVVDGEIIHGETITVLVTFEGNPVAGAQVEVDDDDVGETDADGLISFTVPYDDELDIETRIGELRGKLEIKLGHTLTLEVVGGEIIHGEEISVLVTLEGNPVAGAEVEVDDDDVGETDADGLISFTVPYDDELDIEARIGELRGKLEIKLGHTLTLEVVGGEIIHGEEISVLVTLDGNPVAGAEVEVDDDDVGETDADGLISFTVPDREVLEIEVRRGELRGELRIEVEEE